MLTLSCGAFDTLLAKKVPEGQACGNPGEQEAAYTWARASITLWGTWGLASWGKQQTSEFCEIVSRRLNRDQKVCTTTLSSPRLQTIAFISHYISRSDYHTLAQLPSSPQCPRMIRSPMPGMTMTGKPRPTALRKRSPSPSPSLRCQQP